MNRDNGTSEEEHLRGRVHVEETAERLTQAFRTLTDVRRSGRVIMLAAVACTASLALVALPARPALAADPTTTTTTVPTPGTTTTTVPTPGTTTTTVPTPDTTTTTVPPSTTTIPTDPRAKGSDLTPGETLTPLPAFASLTDTQRAVLKRLQTANDLLATRRFALFVLADQIATANDHLDAARVRENAAVEREIFGLLRAALDREDATTRALSVFDTSHRTYLARALARAPSDVSVLDARLRRFESERTSAQRARVQAQAGVAALKALVAAQTQGVTDATAAKAAAESAAESALGSDAVRPQADAITAALATAQAGQTAPAILGGIALPIPGARLGSPYGIRIDPLTGGGGFHPGLDFDAGSGTSIRAAAAGVVVMAGDCGGYGSCVVIDHGSSLATVYAHQSELLSQVGDQVRAGQIIGLVGSTGKSTGPHLHFEFRLRGVPIDPVPTLTT